LGCPVASGVASSSSAAGWRLTLPRGACCARSRNLPGVARARAAVSGRSSTCSRDAACSASPGARLRISARGDAPACCCARAARSSAGCHRARASALTASCSHPCETGHRRCLLHHTPVAAASPRNNSYEQQRTETRKRTAHKTSHRVISSLYRYRIVFTPPKAGDARDRESRIETQPAFDKRYERASFVRLRAASPAIESQLD
jgi:hypothetical protein